VIVVSDPQDPPVPGAVLARAGAADVAEILVLQRCCWAGEAISNGTLAIPALHESLDDVAHWVAEMDAWTVRLGGRLVAGVRGERVGDDWEIGRLMVAPDLNGRGIARWLLAHIERRAPPSTTRLGLFTGRLSERNRRMYGRAGYVPAEPPPGTTAAQLEVAIYLAKPRG
jgi:GNAT superfamily N-acetyltransferase